MSSNDFEILKQEPTTCDILKWIIKEYIESGISRKTMIDIVKNTYDEIKRSK